MLVPNEDTTRQQELRFGQHYKNFETPKYMGGYKFFL